MFKDKEDRPKWFIDHRLVVRASSIHGCGVFATEDIPKRTLIESCPVVLCHGNTMEMLVEMNEGERHILCDYPFQWDSGDSIHMLAFVLGWGSLYNHSYDPSAQWKSHYDGYNAMEYWTKKDIKAGDEIFVMYTPNSDNLWFCDDDIEMGHIDYKRAGGGMTFGMEVSEKMITARKIVGMKERQLDPLRLTDYDVRKKSNSKEPSYQKDVETLGKVWTPGPLVVKSSE